MNKVVVRDVVHRLFKEVDVHRCDQEGGMGCWG
jgi:hypothetical protein